jgi:hypothetical protein
MKIKKPVWCPPILYKEAGEKICGRTSASKGRETAKKVKKA